MIRLDLKKVKGDMKEVRWPLDLDVDPDSVDGDIENFMDRAIASLRSNAGYDVREFNKKYPNATDVKVESQYERGYGCHEPDRSWAEIVGLVPLTDEEKEYITRVTNRERIEKEIKARTREINTLKRSLVEETMKDEPDPHHIEMHKIHIKQEMDNKTALEMELID